MDRLFSMKVFAEVVKQGSFTAAAEQLDITRVKATRYVTDLENWLGTRLLQRSTRRISITDAGQVFLLQCERMLELESEMEQQLANQGQIPRGELRMTSSTSFGQSQLAGAVTDYLKCYPDVSVDLMMVDRTVNLIEERVDLAIRISGELDPGLVARRLAPCRSVLCATEEYLARHGTPETPADLSRFNCLSYANYGKTQWRFKGPGGEVAEIPVVGNLSANEAGVLMQAVLAGAGISMQPTYLAGPLIKEQRLVPVLQEWSLPELSIWGVYLSRKLVPASVREMLNFLADRFQDAPEWDEL